MEDGELAVAAPVLAVSDVRKVYQMSEVHVEALRGMDLSLAAAEPVALLGPSGRGEVDLAEYHWRTRPADHRTRGVPRRRLDVGRR